MSKVDVFWTPIAGCDPTKSKDEAFQNILYYEPEPLLKHLVSTRGKDLDYLKCPAFTDYVKNTFVIKSPIDVSFTYDENGLRTHSYDQYWFDKNVLARDDKNRLMSFDFANYLMYTKTSVMIEQLPAHFDTLKDIQIIPGTFDISKWIRPITFSFEVAHDKRVDIKRGDVLFYVKFRTPNNEIVKLNRVELTEDLVNVTNACTSVKDYISNNTLQKNYTLAEPFLKRMKSKLFPSKCPFGFKK